MRFVFLLVFTALISAGAHAETPPKRVVSIGGANTEIVFALGAGSVLVGSDTTSSFPTEASQMPKVGYMRALSAEGILSLDPDLVILSNESGPPPVIAQLRQTGVEILEIQAARSVADIQNNITVIANRLVVAPAAKKLNEKIDAELVQLRQALNKDLMTRKVMFVLQHGGGSPMVAGTHTAANSIIEMSGGENVVTHYSGYKPLTPEAALKLQPDFILLTTMGLERAGGLESFLKSPGINLTSAARQKRAIAMDSLYLLGFGPRTVEAALQLHQHYLDKK